MTSRHLALAPVTFEAGDLLLRPFDEDDEPAVAEAMRDPGILRWAAGQAVLEAPEAERGRRWLESRITGWEVGNAVLAVTDIAESSDTAGGALLGAVSLRDVNRIPDQAVTAYWVTPRFRGRGIGSRALDAVARWAFTPSIGGGLGLHRLTLNHVVINTASCRVAAKAGFQLEGTMREEFVEPTGRRHDSHLHARLATDRTPEG
ncbi:GNAT family N-acetyltransferase [Actinopolymorpha pittospori]